MENRKLSLGLILITGLLAFVIYLLSVYQISYQNKTTTFTQTYISNPISFYSQTFFSEENYSRILISGNKSDLELLESELQTIKFSANDYPTLKSIKFYDNNLCNGHYLPLDFKIELSHCDNETFVRRYIVSKNDFNLFVLGHELGHAKLGNDENLADEYAYNITGKGVLSHYGK